MSVGSRTSAATFLHVVLVDSDVDKILVFVTVVVVLPVDVLGV